MVGNDESPRTRLSCEQSKCNLAQDCTLYFHCSIEDDLNQIEDGRFGKYLARLATIPAIRKRMAESRRRAKIRGNARRIRQDR